MLSDFIDVSFAQEAIDRFCSQSQSFLSFILGVTNHWVAIFVQKIASRVNLIYFDSYNVPVLTATPDELKLIIDKEEDEHRKHKGCDWTTEEREETVQAYEDKKNVVLMLAHCCSGNRNLRKEMERRPSRFLAARRIIKRLKAIMKERNDHKLQSFSDDELKSFLSTKNGFQSEQVWSGHVFHCCTPYILLFVSTTLTCH